MAEHEGNARAEGRAPKSDAAAFADAVHADAVRTDAACAGAACTDVEALFAHLEELVGLLPEMQELGERLARARAAEAVLAHAHELDVRELMLTEEDAHLAAEQEALHAAQTAGDEREIDRHRRNVLYYGQRRGLRVGPVENGRAALEKALKAGGFATVEDARAASMPAAEMDAAEQRIAGYQADYATTLAACQEVEGAEASE